MFLFSFGKNGYHTVSTCESCMASIFLMAITKSNIEIARSFPKLPEIARIDICTKSRIFRKILMLANFNFCLHNGVLDTKKMDFFPFLWINFFKQAKISYFFCMAC